MEFSLTQIVIAALSSGGILSGLVTLGVFINKLLTDRRKTRQDREDKVIHDSVESKRLELEFEDKHAAAVVDNLWKLLDARDRHIASLKTDLQVCEEQSSLSRPMLIQVYKNVRAIRKEIESLNVMVLSDEDTNVFMRRFQIVKQLLDETENILP